MGVTAVTRGRNPGGLGQGGGSGSGGNESHPHCVLEVDPAGMAGGFNVEDKIRRRVKNMPRVLAKQVGEWSFTLTQGMLQAGMDLG